MAKASKFKGVYKLSIKNMMSLGKTWKSAISIDGKTISLGFFNKEREAALAFDKVAITLGRSTNILKPLHG